MKRQRSSSTRRQSSVRSRPLQVENLERRLMLAANVAAFQNPLDPNDVNNDNYVTPRDVLIMINLINEPDSWGEKVGGFIDASGDKLFTNQDALYVINTLNAPDTLPTDNADKFEKLVATLENAPVTLDGDLKELA
ncbi:MAG: dockerin type I domain-containing protein, partial [Pirellulaceae bacterium]